MPLLLGLDLGTSSFKVSAYRDTGEHLGTVLRPTPWENVPVHTRLNPGTFAETVRTMVEQCAAEHADEAVAAIGVTGMAETMFIETADAEWLPARPWNQRWRQEPLLPDDHLQAATGLVDTARTPAVEFRRVTDAGIVIRSWSGLPEYAVQVLGGIPVAERSLAARTGLVDVLADDWSTDLLGWAGVGESVRPRLQPAGQASGTARIRGRCSDAVLSVAGHDHVVAALGAGAYDDVSVFNSLGTGEALIAKLGDTPEEISSESVARFNAAKFNVGLGLENSDIIAFCGLGTGNRFNLLLDALAEAGFGREELLHSEACRSANTKKAAHDLSSDAVALIGTLFGPDWETLRSSDLLPTVIRNTISNLDSARALWWKAVTDASGKTREALATLAHLKPRKPRLAAAGGWLNNAGIREVREQALGAFRVPIVEQCGTRGAALVAGLAAGIYSSRSDFPTPTSAGGSIL